MVGMTPFSLQLWTDENCTIIDSLFSFTRKILGTLDTYVHSLSSSKIGGSLFFPAAIGFPLYIWFWVMHYTPTLGAIKVKCGTQ